MSPKLVIKAIEKLVLSMSELDERERWHNYATIRTLTDELFKWAEMRGKPPTGLVSEKIVELMSGVEGLAGFSTRQSMEWFQQEALAAISRLEHPNLFGRLDE
jgi:hypothetical protein